MKLIYFLDVTNEQCQYKDDSTFIKYDILAQCMSNISINKNKFDS